MFVPYSAPRGVVDLGSRSRLVAAKDKDQIHPVGKTHINCQADVATMNARMRLERSTRNRTFLFGGETSTSRPASTTQDIFYNDLVFTDKYLGETVSKRPHSGDSVDPRNAGCSYAYVTASSKAYSIDATKTDANYIRQIQEEDDLPERDLIRSYRINRRLIVEQLQCSFVGVAFGDVLHERIGVGDSGRLAINTAGLSTIFADSPVRSGEMLVADFPRFREDHGGVPSIHRPGTKRDRDACKQPLVVYPLAMAVKFGYYTSENVDDPKLLPWVIGTCVRGATESGKRVDIKLTPPQRYDSSTTSLAVEHTSPAILNDLVNDRKISRTDASSRDGLHHIGKVQVNAVYDIATACSYRSVSASVTEPLLKWLPSGVADVHDIFERDLVFSHCVTAKSRQLSQSKHKSGTNNEPNVLSSFNGAELREMDMLWTDVPEFKPYITHVLCSITRFLLDDRGTEACPLGYLLKKLLMCSYVYQHGTTFVGVAMGDMKFSDIGRRSSGRLAVNMKAGQATIFGDHPLINVGDTVVVQIPEPEVMTETAIDTFKRKLVDVAETYLHSRNAAAEALNVRRVFDMPDTCLWLTECLRPQVQNTQHRMQTKQKKGLFVSSLSHSITDKLFISKRALAYKYAETELLRDRDNGYLPGADHTNSGFKELRTYNLDRIEHLLHQTPPWLVGKCIRGSSFGGERVDVSFFDENVLVDKRYI